MTEDGQRVAVRMKRKTDIRNANTTPQIRSDELKIVKRFEIRLHGFTDI